VRQEAGELRVAGGGGTERPGGWGCAGGKSGICARGDGGRGKSGGRGNRPWGWGAKKINNFLTQKGQGTKVDESKNHGGGKPDINFQG